MIAATARFVRGTQSARTRSHVSLALAQLGFQRCADLGPLGEWIGRITHFGDIGHTGGDVAERMGVAENVELVVVNGVKNALGNHRCGDFSGAHRFVALRLRDQLRERRAVIVFQIYGSIAMRF